MTATGQDLVRIGLVSHVPNEPVPRRIEDVVQRHCQFDDAEARAQMAARPGDRSNGLRTQFISNSPEIRRAHLPQLLRSVDGVEKHWPFCFPLKSKTHSAHQNSPSDAWIEATPSPVRAFLERSYMPSLRRRLLPHFKFRNRASAQSGNIFE